MSFQYVYTQLKLAWKSKHIARLSHVKLKPQLDYALEQKIHTLTKRFSDQLYLIQHPTYIKHSHFMERQQNLSSLSKRKCKTCMYKLTRNTKTYTNK